MSSKIKRVVIAVVLAALAVMSYYFIAHKKGHGPEPVRTTGVVEAIETNISSKISGRLDNVFFREGDRVKKGDLVASVESGDLEASLRQAEAGVVSARSTLASGYDAVESARAEAAAAEAGARNAEAAVRRAEAQLGQAEKDLKREKELFDKGIVARADLDNTQTNMDTKDAELSEARASLAQAKSQSKAAAASFKQAKGNVETLKSKVSEAERQADYQKALLSYAKIYSPVDSVVEYRSLEPGEVVAPGTSIITLIDLDHLWVRIDLEQRYATRVRAGQRAQVSLEGMPDKVFWGTVFDIGREGEFAVERDVTRGRQDIKTFRTRIRVDNPEGVLKPGMTVIVEIPVQ